MEKLKGIMVYMRETELDTLRALKEEAFEQGDLVSISGMIRSCAMDFIRSKKAALQLLDGTEN